MRKNYHRRGEQGMKRKKYHRMGEQGFKTKN